MRQERFHATGKVEVRAFRARAALLVLLGVAVGLGGGTARAADEPLDAEIADSVESAVDGAGAVDGTGVGTGDVDVDVAESLVETQASPGAIPDTAEPAGASAGPADPTRQPATIGGSVTSRATITGGDGNDRLSTRVSLEWTAGRWSGGLSANLDNGDSGSLWRPDGIGSLEIPERWVAWKGVLGRDRDPAEQGRVELRLGTSYGLRFGQGLVLGSATFEGVQLAIDAPHSKERASGTRIVALAGATDAIDPDDLADEPLTLFPTDERLGTKGRLVGVRAELHPRDALQLGFNLLGVQGEGPDGKQPSAGLLSADTEWSRGMVDFAAELAGRADGGWGVFARTTVSPSEAWGVAVEARRYDDFLSPVGSAPAYAGLSGGDTTNETGGLVRFDFAPCRRVSGSIGTDWSVSRDKTAEKTVHRVDHRLAMHFVVTKTTALAWGLEHETTDDGHDGTIHSLLSTTSFRKGGRLAARLQFDRSTTDPRDSLRLSYRLPLWGRRFTLLVDDTITLDRSGKKNELEAGGSIKVGDSSFLTVRGTLAEGPESVDVTWYQRF